MPTATTKEFTNSRPRLPFTQAVAAFSRKRSPGSHGGGTVSTSAVVCEPTRKASQIGTQTSSRPKTSRRWEAMSRPRVRSTMSGGVGHVRLDVAEMDDGVVCGADHHEYRL